MIIAGNNHNSDSSKLHAQTHSMVAEILNMIKEDRKARSCIDLKTMDQDDWMEIAAKANLRIKICKQIASTYPVKPGTDKFDWEDTPEPVSGREVRNKHACDLPAMSESKQQRQEHINAYCPCPCLCPLCHFEPLQFMFFSRQQL